MDFKIFCQDESKSIAFLKEYRDILTNFKKEKIETKNINNHDMNQITSRRFFYSDSEKPVEKDFELFRCPSYNIHKPYEDDKGIHTFCDKCDGRLSSEYLNHFKTRPRILTSKKRVIPEHLMGRFKRKESSSESEESDNTIEPQMLYKVIIKTKEGKDSGTSAHVCIRLVGTTSQSDSIILLKKCGSLKFSFTPGSKEVFYIKSIVLQTLKGVNIKLDAKESVDEWYVDFISIEELAGDKRKWFCKVDRWLSSWKEKCQLIAKLKPEYNVIPDIVYSIKIWTSNESVDEFSGQLAIQLHGLEGKSDNISLVINNRLKLIKKGSIEIFQIKCKEVGQIKALRIAIGEAVHPSILQSHQNSKLDGKWKSSLIDDKDKGSFRSQKTDIKGRPSSSFGDKEKGWKDIKIDKILIQWKGSDKKDHVIELLMNDWIGLSHKMEKKSLLLKEALDIKKKKDLSKLSETQEESTYDVTFYTGKQTFSGTDATVYVKFFGSYGVWSKTYEFQDYDKKRFESGKEDTFRIKGPNVGSIEKVNVSHSGTGVASGWKLKKMMVIRHLTATEICNVLDELKNKSKLPKEIAIKDGKVFIDRTCKSPINSKNNEIKEHKKKGSRYEDSSTSLNEDDINDKSKPLGRTIDADFKGKDNVHSDESFVTQLPYAEETTFMCQKWLTGSAGQKSLQQMLDVENKKLLFSPISLLLNLDK